MGTGKPLPGEMRPRTKKDFVDESLDWLREFDPGRLDTVDDVTAKAFTSLAGIDYETRPKSKKEMKKKAMKDSLNWIRRNDAKVDENPDNDLVNALSKITGKPLPDDMTSRAKKDFVDESMNGLREFDPGNLDTVDDATAEAFTSLAGIKYDRRPKSQKEKKKKAMNDALNWIRKNDPDVDTNPDDDLVNALSKLTGNPVPTDMTPQSKKDFVDNSINWLRESDPGRLDMVDDATAGVFASLAGIDYEAPLKTKKEKKKKAMNDALNWIRSNDPIVDDDPDEDLINALSKITGKPLPKKMTRKAKKNFVDESMEWLRDFDPGRLDTVDDVTAEAFTKMAGIDYTVDSNPKKETKKNVMKRALRWIRTNNAQVNDNPDEDLVKALSIITGKHLPDEMTPQAKKNFVEESLDWLREFDPGRLDTVDDATAEAFANLAGIEYEARPKTKKDKKKKAMKDALNWIRSNDPMVGDDPDDDLANALSKITGKTLPDDMTPQAKKEFVDESMDWLREFDPGRLDTI